MRELEYKEFLESAEEINSKNKAVKSRISRAYKAEDILGCSLDEIVIDDDRMYDALQLINHDSRENNGNIQNAVRWYGTTERAIEGRLYRIKRKLRKVLGGDFYDG